MKHLRLIKDPSLELLICSIIPPPNVLRLSDEQNTRRVNLLHYLLFSLPQEMHFPDLILYIRLVCFLNLSLARLKLAQHPLFHSNYIILFKLPDYNPLVTFHSWYKGVDARAVTPFN